MEKQIFKIGDKAYNHKYGWGKVTDVKYAKGRFLYNIEFIEVWDMFDDSSLSFTEYTLDGFSQERSINYEEYIGKWGVFKKFTETKAIGKLKRYNPNKTYSFLMENGVEYTRFEPLTEEQLKALNLKNE